MMTSAYKDHEENYVFFLFHFGMFLLLFVLEVVFHRPSGYTW